MKLDNRLSRLLDELLALNPRLSVVQSQMKAAGLAPGRDLVACMEVTLQAMETAKAENKESEVDSEIP